MRPVMLLATGRKCAITRETLRRKRVQERGVEGRGRGKVAGVFRIRKGRGRRGVEMEGKHTDAANVSFILFAPIYRQDRENRRVEAKFLLWHCRETV